MKQKILSQQQIHIERVCRRKRKHRHQRPLWRGLKTYEACAEEIKHTLTKAFNKITNYLLEEEQEEQKK